MKRCSAWSTRAAAHAVRSPVHREARREESPAGAGGEMGTPALLAGTQMAQPSCKSVRRFLIELNLHSLCGPESVPWSLPKGNKKKLCLDKDPYLKIIAACSKKSLDELGFSQHTVSF